MQIVFCFAKAITSFSLCAKLVTDHYQSSHVRKTPYIKSPITFLKIWQPPALPYRLQYSTIGRPGLNHRVRDGNGCVPQTHRHQKIVSHSVTVSSCLLSYDSLLSFPLIAQQQNNPYLFFLRKEVIQPHLPIRLPCYDFTPVIEPAFGSSLLSVGSLASGISNSHGVTGGVYKTRERIHRSILICDY